VSDRQHAPRGPTELGDFFYAKRYELDELNVALQTAHELAEQAEERWIEIYDEIVAQLEEEMDKLPGEDLRISIARRRGGALAWTNLRKAQRAVKRMEKQGTNIAQAISACQSEAKLLISTEMS